MKTLEEAISFAQDQDAMQRRYTGLAEDFMNNPAVLNSIIHMMRQCMGGTPFDCAIRSAMLFGLVVGCEMERQDNLSRKEPSIGPIIPGVEDGL